jgi:hypothetical protein
MHESSSGIARCEDAVGQHVERLRDEQHIFDDGMVRKEWDQGVDGDGLERRRQEIEAKASIKVTTVISSEPNAGSRYVPKKESI